MGTGIMMCGLNGAGKSTLGKALAEKLNLYVIDDEDLYFPKTDSHDIYAFSRSRKEAEQLLFRKINEHQNFIFTAVKGDYGEEFYAFFQYVILINVPNDIRMRRVKNRSFQKFGNRMLPGGDLYERETRFFAFVKSRSENMVEEWVQALRCPIIRVDGTKPIEENTAFIIKQIQP